MYRIATIQHLPAQQSQLASSWQTKIKQAVTQYRPCIITKNKPIYIYIYIYICTHQYVHSWATNQSLSREWTYPLAQSGMYQWPWISPSSVFISSLQNPTWLVTHQNADFIIFTQPLRSGRIWHKINSLAEFNRFEFRVFLLD